MAFSRTRTTASRVMALPAPLRAFTAKITLAVSTSDALTTTDTPAVTLISLISVADALVLTDAPDAELAEVIGLTLRTRSRAVTLETRGRAFTLKPRSRAVTLKIRN